LLKIIILSSGIDCGENYLTEKCFFILAGSDIANFTMIGLFAVEVNNGFDLKPKCVQLSTQCVIESWQTYYTV